MRSVTTNITNLEQGADLKPRHSLLVKNEILSFGATSVNQNSSVNYVTGHSYMQRPSNDRYGWVSFLDTSGQLMLRYIDLTLSTDYGPATSGSRVLASGLGGLRAGMWDYGNGTNRVVWATDSGSSTIQLKYLDIQASFTNPITGTGSNFGAVIPAALISTSVLVRRVEAVALTTSGAFVAVGTHDFNRSLSSIEFYFNDGTNTYKLETFFQYPLTQTYTTWDAVASGGSHITAYTKVSGSDAGKVVVFVNTLLQGRTCYFTYWNGIESPLIPVVPMDEEQKNLYFVASNVSYISGLYYLVGNITKNNLDEKNTITSSTSFDCYLTSDDLENWSINERSSFIFKQKSLGRLHYCSYTGKVHYGGRGLYTEAAASTYQAPGLSGTSTPLDQDMMDFNHHQISNGADTFDVGINNRSGQYVNHALLKRNSTLYLSSGQDTDLVQIGVFSIDDVGSGVDSGGFNDMRVTSRDYAGKKLSDWKPVADLWIGSISDIQTNLSSEESIIVKSPIRDIASKDLTKNKIQDTELMFTTNYGMRYRGLNNPGIIFADTLNEDGLTKATVKFTVDATNNPHFSTLGIVFGAVEDTSGNFKGNVLTFPKAHGWSLGDIEPKVYKFNFAAIDLTDTNKEDTGLKNLGFRKNPLYIASGAGMTARTIAANGAYRMKQNSFQIPAEELWDVAVKKAGKNLQYFAKKKVTTTAGMANAAFFISRGQFTWGTNEALKNVGKNYGGLSASTDVFGNTDGFIQAAEDDVEVSLNDARNYQGTSYSSTISTFTQEGTNQRKIYPPVGFNPANVWVGKWINISGTVVRIIGIKLATNPAGGPMTLWLSEGLFYGASSPTFLYKEDLGNGSGIWGYADSGYAYKDVLVGTSTYSRFYKDTKAKISSILRKGRAAFITDDSTAITIKHIETNGTFHELKSGSSNTPTGTMSDATKVYTTPDYYASLIATDQYGLTGPTETVISSGIYGGGTGFGWDLTNPLPSGYTAYSGSEPSAWRMIFHHGYIFANDPSAYGLPDGNSASKYFKIDDEVIRYITNTVTKPGWPVAGLSPETWTSIPTFYSVIKNTAKGSTQYKNWWYLGNYLGDNLGDLNLNGTNVTPAGLLVEFSSRSNNETSKSDQYYVVSNTNVTTGQSYTNASSITINKAYPNSTKDGDMIVASGRGQFSTKKETHDVKSPVVYYPCDSAGNIAEIQTSKLSVYSGRIRTTQDMLKNIASMAGVRNVNFRNAYNSSYQSVWRTFSISTTATVLPLQENLENFTLEGFVHLGGKGFGTGVYSSKLNIDFRNYYRLTIQQYNSPTNMTAGIQGNVFVALSTTSSDITAPTACVVDQDGNQDNAYKWLQGAIVHMSDRNLSGATTGSGANWTHTEDVSKMVYLKLMVNKNDVIVEINGKHLWSFDLNELIRVNTPGTIEISYSNAIASNTSSWWVQELGDPSGNMPVRNAQTARSTIDEITKDRHILSRTNSSGGVEFAQFWNRDNFGNFAANLTKDSWSSKDGELTGHFQVSGKVTSDYLDESILQLEGYKFDSASNQLVENNESAIREGRLQIRLRKELLDQRVVGGFGRIALQPEDKVTLFYNMGSGLPSLASKDMVVTSIQMTANNKSLKGDYTLRAYIPTY